MFPESKVNKCSLHNLEAKQNKVLYVGDKKGDDNFSKKRKKMPVCLSQIANAAESVIRIHELESPGCTAVSIRNFRQ